MNKLVASYLAIRNPLLWISLFLSIVTINNIINTIAFYIWIFTLIFSEYSYERYCEFRKWKIVKGE